MMYGEPPAAVSATAWSNVAQSSRSKLNRQKWLRRLQRCICRAYTACLSTFLLHTGLVYRALGFPPQFFTVMFAVPRIVGYLSHWRESLSDPDTKIMRPQEDYRVNTRLDAPWLPNAPVARDAQLIFASSYFMGCRWANRATYDAELR